MLGWVSQLITHRDETFFCLPAKKSWGLIPAALNQKILVAPEISVHKIAVMCSRFSSNEETGG